ncbi:hypothetical protein, partial [Paracidovorax valerianellae]|uniref:hypothetical protein n=1 Tax=Paracidovorax valerianellae TaxID=187868 RepID=UPI00230372C7
RYWNNHTLQILRPSISRTTCQIKGLQIVQGGLITAKIVDDSAIMAMVVDKATVNEGKSNNPTHMKLTAIYPDVGDSYTCIPEIESIKIK